MEKTDLEKQWGSLKESVDASFEDLSVKLLKENETMFVSLKEKHERKFEELEKKLEKSL